MTEEVHKALAVSTFTSSHIAKDVPVKLALIMCQDTQVIGKIFNILQYMQTMQSHSVVL